MHNVFHSDFRSALQIAATATFFYLNPTNSLGFSHTETRIAARRSLKYVSLKVRSCSSSTPSSSVTSNSEVVGEIQRKKKEKTDNKPSICTADELHYVSIPNTEWRLALWRYTPCPKAPPRNHPLLLLSGVGTNAIGFDLSPKSSFARHMSNQGFDTWILEARGAGLSTRGAEASVIEESVNSGIVSDLIESSIKGSNGLSTRGAEASAIEESVNSGIVSDLIESSIKGSNDVLTTEQQTTVNLSSLAGTEISAASNIKELGTAWDESQLVSKLTETFLQLSERLSGFLNEGQSRVISAKLFDQLFKLLEDAQLSDRFNEIRGKLSGLLEARQNSAVATQVQELSQRLVNIVEEGQRSVSPQLFDLHERLSTTIEDFQKQLDLIVKYDWDFDNFLEEDVPAAMQYIKAQSKPKDGKLLAVGHSMGGILLYALLSRYGLEGRNSELAAVVTLASSLDYTSSNSSLKMILPLADPAQALNVPVVPLGALLAAVYPLSSRSPYVLSWLNHQISAEDMMHPELLEKLVLNNFFGDALRLCELHPRVHTVIVTDRVNMPSLSVGNLFTMLLQVPDLFLFSSGCACTVPAKLLLQLTTAFREGGLRNRNGTLFYSEGLRHTNVPVLALAGDLDMICPPAAVYETVKILPQHLVTYKVFGESAGPHYAHYDLVGGRLAVDEVYPCIVEFLSRHDDI